MHGDEKESPIDWCSETSEKWFVFRNSNKSKSNFKLSPSISKQFHIMPLNSVRRTRFSVLYIVSKGCRRVVKFIGQIKERTLGARTRVVKRHVERHRNSGNVWAKMCFHQSNLLSAIVHKGKHSCCAQSFVTGAGEIPSEEISISECQGCDRCAEAMTFRLIGIYWKKVQL